ncbi:hypothetical protein CDL15_Pgr006145 [Punica granatum]|uniref:Uncharacterized protein n=1 Tax=Punica granatum TaxID=22663 RepID=A0A218VU62_PUNGR|nr:hypothetical protein CDL15_Pgr006145 [Punica granatum]
MFVALDKLFALHNAMLLESHLIKAFFMCSIDFHHLHVHKYEADIQWLCITFFIEVLVLRFTTLNIEEQAKILTFFRLLFAFLASAQLLHAIFTYRDYEVFESSDTVILDGEDLPDVLDTSEDPDFDVSRDVGESSLATSVRKYDPCRRLR